ncbi:hypothetical protein NJ76_21790 [Rhodococcus sp. IITR03]|nr:hypothetical protein NJ76_21790 [Rhodococcus sp. IITR03]
MPSALEIVEAAFSAGHATLTVTQAAGIWAQLNDMRDPGYTREVWLDLAMIGAKSIHDNNLAMIAASTVTEIGPPRGFENVTPDDWAIVRNDRITRWWGKDIGDTAATIAVRVIDEIVDGRIIRHAPDLYINVEGAFSASETHDIIDALQAAVRALAETEGVDA